LGNRARTDRIDAEVIARFAEATKLQIRSLPNAAARRRGSIRQFDVWAANSSGLHIAT
jgi:transposase